MRSPPREWCHTGAPQLDRCPPRHRTHWRQWLRSAPRGASAGAPSEHPGAPPATGASDAAWTHVLRLLPDDLETTARTSGALTRRRRVASAGALLWLVLAYSVADWSLRLVATLALPRGMGDLSHVAVRARLQAARPWVQQVVSTLLGLTRATTLAQPVRLRLVDATTVSAPGSTGTDWRVHASVELAPEGPPRLDHVDLTDAHGAESLRRHPVAPGDILLADRGHPRRADLGAILAPAAPAPPGPPVQVVVRIGWQNLPLQQPTPERAALDLVGWLPTLTGPTERPVVVATPQGELPLRLVATPLPEDAANAARRRLRQQAKKKGRTPDARSLLAAGYVLLVTNLPAAPWDPAAVLALYRVRWQVELVFKRLKGLWHLDHLRARDPALAQVYVLGTLLGALLADRASAPQAATGHAAAAALWFLSVDRPVSLWRWAALGHTTLLAALLGPLTYTQIAAALPQLRRHLCDPPRRRPQQAALARACLRTLPPPATAAVPCLS